MTQAQTELGKLPGHYLALKPSQPCKIKRYGTEYGHVATWLFGDGSKLRVFKSQYKHGNVAPFSDVFRVGL